jgi:hypothetical protein
MKVYRSTKKQNRRSQERRQFEARERQEEYDKLSPQQKLAKLGTYRASRQRARLGIKIDG